MPVPLKIDDKIFAYNKSWGSLEFLQKHKNILETWRQSGVLIYAGKDLKDCALVKSLAKHAKRLPCDVRKLWQDAILRYPRLRSTDTAWSGEISLNFSSLGPEAPSILVVDDDKAASEFGVIGFSEFFDSGNIEVVRMSACEQSVLLQRDKALSGKSIKKGESFQQIWDSRFKWLVAAENTSQIFICDRYALTNSPVWAKDKYHSKRVSGLERFLLQVANTATTYKYISLITAWPDRHDRYGRRLTSNERAQLMSDFKGFLQSRLPVGASRKIKSIDVFMKNSSDFPDDHARHVRFDQSYVWWLDKGLVMLDGFNSPENEIKCWCSSERDTIGECVIRDTKLMDSADSAFSRGRIVF